MRVVCATVDGVLFALSGVLHADRLRHVSLHWVFVATFTVGRMLLLRGPRAAELGILP